MYPFKFNKGFNVVLLLVFLILAFWYVGTEFIIMRKFKDESVYFGMSLGAERMKFEVTNGNFPVVSRGFHLDGSLYRINSSIASNADVQYQNKIVETKEPYANKNNTRSEYSINTNEHEKEADFLNKTEHDTQTEISLNTTSNFRNLIVKAKTIPYYYTALLLNSTGRDVDKTNTQRKTIKKEVTDSQTFIQSTQNRLKKRNIILEIKDIKESKKNFFFVESRCSLYKNIKTLKGSKGLVLNARQCCSVESTARTNPGREVFILHSCPLSEDFLEHSPPYVRQLMNSPNVHVVRMSTETVLHGSPAQSLYERGSLEQSAFPMEHASDLIRLALLWKYGGTYCDLDVVNIRSFDALGENWVGAQDAVTLANGVLNFEQGHHLLREALSALDRQYDPEGWSANGPLLITPLILRYCGVDTVAQAIDNCKSQFKVYNSTVLYPLHYTAVQEMFREGADPGFIEEVMHKGSYSVHMWNKISYNEKLRVNSTQMYSLLASQFCPGVYYNCGDRM